MERKIDEIQNRLNSKIIEFVQKNKIHFLLAFKTAVILLISAFTAGFCYSSADYIYAFIYIITIAIFIYFIPFERIFLNSYESLIIKRNEKKTNLNKELIEMHGGVEVSRQEEEEEL